MRIAITGTTGMLGQVLCPLLARHHDVVPLSIDRLDITSLEDTRRQIVEAQPNWVVHVAAFTQVDDAETKPLEAYRVNAVGTRNVALAAQEAGAAIAYFSTDYVFNGRKTEPYREWDVPEPLNHYGRSKLAGEMFVQTLCPKYLIIRTSWLFGPGGVNFVEKILARAARETRIQVVDDQRGSPTFTVDLAEMTLKLLERGSRGIYHVTNLGSCTWYEFAREALSLREIKCTVTPVASSVFAAPARRPSYSVLDNYLLKCEGIPLLPPWQDALARYLKSAF
ncbi:MAG TPA: dTDP-4-dehydrorhamnose reductase [Acidobacteriota bacterium]|nr:dTDP-4-dehydrorhamnose reductase [Acidobacteriota bacterium]